MGLLEGKREALKETDTIKDKQIETLKSLLTEALKALGVKKVS
jgi:hypothetical protein